MSVYIPVVKFTINAQYYLNFGEVFLVIIMS